VNVLGIETSCDECSAAIVRDGKEILSNVVATQIELHKPYEGVVPELASRLHTEWIAQVVKSAIEKSGLSMQDIDAVAVQADPVFWDRCLSGSTLQKALPLPWMYLSSP